jgi:hypothetical protein
MQKSIVILLVLSIAHESVNHLKVCNNRIKKAKIALNE